MSRRILRAYHAIAHAVVVTWLAEFEDGEEPMSYEDAVDKVMDMDLADIDDWLDAQLGKDCTCGHHASPDALLATDDIAVATECETGFDAIESFLRKKGEDKP